MCGQGLRSDAAGFLCGLSLGRLSAEVAQRRHPALPHNLFGDFVHGGEHAADAARHGIVWHRAVGDGEVRLFDEAVPVNLE